MITRALVALVLAVASLQTAAKRGAAARAAVPAEGSRARWRARIATRGSGPIRSWTPCGIGDGSVVADLGAGGGWFTVRLARRVGPQRPRLRRRHPAADDRVDRPAREARGLRRPGHDGARHRARSEAAATASLDAVLIVDAYHEIEHPVTLLRNLARSLKPDGRIGIVDFTSDGGGPGPGDERARRSAAGDSRRRRPRACGCVSASSSSATSTCSSSSSRVRADAARRDERSRRSSATISSASIAELRAARARRRAAGCSSRWPTRVTRRPSRSAPC